MLPSQKILKQIPQQILKISNRQGEFERQVHYGLFLLGYEAGLRVSEAINFDLSAKTHKGLYRITKTKGKKERFVYIPEKVISELKANNWKPNHTNRFNFYHFLKKIRQELNLPANIELTPHTLRRTFATYQAENGLPLPLLQKLLGHSSIRTTALYWMNIYNEDDDTDDILTGKVWLEKPCWKLKPESAAPVNLNLDELSELAVPNSLVSESPPNYLSKIQQLEEQLTTKDEKIKRLESELAQETEQNTNLRQNLNEQNITLQHEKHQIQQDLATAPETIDQLTRELTNEREKCLTAENNLSQEKQISHNLRQQLQAEQNKSQFLQETNTNLTKKIHAYEQNYVNLQNTYQITLKDKQTAEKQLNQLTQEIKNFAQLYQWQKLHYYQQLEQERNQMEAQIIHSYPPPFKFQK